VYLSEQLRTIARKYNNGAQKETSI
jgi:hypothetical protein